MLSTYNVLLNIGSYLICVAILFTLNQFDYLFHVYVILDSTHAFHSKPVNVW